MAPDIKMALALVMDKSMRQQKAHVSFEQVLMSASDQGFNAKRDIIVSEVSQAMKDCFDGFHKPGQKYKRINGWTVLRSLKLEAPLVLSAGKTSCPTPDAPEAVKDEALKKDHSSTLQSSEPSGA